MTDQTVPNVTDDDRKLAREWAEFIEADVTGLSSRRKRAAARVILDAVPTPPRPTLADMAREERDGCRWMQADIEGAGRAIILLPNASVGRAVMLNRWGKVIYVAHDTVTPRPDLPRMEWPGNKKPDPAPALPDGWRLADHEDYGRVIVTNPTPNSDGYVCFVLHSYSTLGHAWHFCLTDELTYLDTGQEADQ